MPSLAEWFIWGALVTLDVWLYDIGAKPWVPGTLTVFLLSAGTARSEWGREQLHRLTRAHRKRKARELAAKRGVSEWLPLEPTIHAEWQTSQRLVTETIKTIAAGTVPSGKMLDEAKRLAPVDLKRAQRLNKQAFETRAKSITRELSILRKRVDRFELAATNVAECFRRLAVYAESPNRSVSVKAFQPRALEYIQVCAADLPTLRGLTESVNQASRHQNHRLDVALDRYVALLRRFAESYEAVQASAQRISTAP
jgi:hypothetical protein